MSLKCWEQLDWRKYIDQFFIYSSLRNPFTDEQKEQILNINLPIQIRSVTRDSTNMLRGKQVFLNEIDAFHEISEQYKNGWLFKLDGDILIPDLKFLEYIEELITKENITPENTTAIGAKVNEKRQRGPNLPNIQGGAYFLSIYQVYNGIFKDTNEEDDVFKIKDLLHIDDQILTFKIYQKNGIIKWISNKLIYTPGYGIKQTILWHFNGGKENKNKMREYYEIIVNKK